jgi:hypothetical protein
VKKTNFDLYLDALLKEPNFASRLQEAGWAWNVTMNVTLPKA